ncbi:hypothetical protein [Aestuariibaculum sediminum]|uniref:Uncharacterized protein n=1 Tax=Aestuariibaculum sediminum TaxID=2770637 RepID=A0A8J6U9S7_9FLAO|nr:hypothetical protein [Aestuariibaculum sediminum]MBD0833657.1 hypothetical protein [Aestuariibaculum sediminum]
MEIGTTITSITLVLICAMPFVLSSHGRRKREKQTLNNLKQFAYEHGHAIGNYDNCGNFIIAINFDFTMVFFQNLVNGTSEYHAIPLRDVKSCLVHKNYKTIGHGKHHQQRIDQLYLYFEMKTNETQKLLFFDINENVQLSGELLVIEKWRTRINEYITK